MIYVMECLMNVPITGTVPRLLDLQDMIQIIPTIYVKTSPIQMCVVGQYFMLSGIKTINGVFGILGINVDQSSLAGIIVSLEIVVRDIATLSVVQLVPLREIGQLLL